jgi:hypothetical protein
VIPDIFNNREETFETADGVAVIFGVDSDMIDYISVKLEKGGFH